MPSSSLRGKTVLLVEDEYVIAMDIASALERSGAAIVGPLAEISQAEHHVEQPLDGAILDVNLQGELVFSFAQQLLERDVTVLFVTGYDHTTLPDAFTDCARLEKPVDSDVVIDKLSQLLSYHAPSSEAPVAGRR
jgi:DNA-binding response OmpR family regulator